MLLLGMIGYWVGQTMDERRKVIGVICREIVQIKRIGCGLSVIYRVCSLRIKERGW